MDDLKHLFAYGIRGSVYASVILVVTVLLAFLKPVDFYVFGRQLEFSIFRDALFYIGGYTAAFVWIKLWVQDYKRGYLPRWLFK